MTPVKAVNHIGIAVRSIDAQRAFYEGVLGAVFEGTEVVPDQKVRVGFFRIGDNQMAMLASGQPAGNRNSRPFKLGEAIDGWTIVKIDEGKSVEIEANAVRETIVPNDASSFHLRPIRPNVG